MPSLEIHKIVFRDLKRLRNFLLPKNQDAAERATETIIDRIDYLKTSPYLGSPYGIYRRLIIPFGRSSYIAFYFFDEARDLVYVLRLIHGRENIAAEEIDHEGVAAFD